MALDRRGRVRSVAAMDTTPHHTTTSADRRTRLGSDGEALAAEHLRRQGLVVLARNWRVTTGEVRGELDLICRDGDTLVVVEVKTRRTRRYGGPLAAVTPAKQARIRSLATAFVRESGWRTRRIRFDVVGVVVPGPGEEPAIHHVRQAF